MCIVLHRQISNATCCVAVTACEGSRRSPASHGSRRAVPPERPTDPIASRVEKSYSIASAIESSGPLCTVHASNGAGRAW